jgi:transposase InsO family protein
MACNGGVQGMCIDLSSDPRKCEACILSKQVRSSVLKIREGARATCRLETVFVDLVGPMSTVSRSGNSYAMHIIDDCTSFCWSLSLKSKAKSFPKLRAWELAVCNETGERIGRFITDGSELNSNAMKTWCELRESVHLLTAPYTSAQNGRAERLHFTIMNKARAMWIACGAPPNLWDEFDVMAAYLSTLTMSSMTHGKTPFELWKGRAPNLSHLHEIGCKAFVLIEGNNPKILAWSIACKLIGYSPQAKAYRCWDPSSGRIYNSFNISFIERKDEIDNALRPIADTPADSKNPVSISENNT